MDERFILLLPAEGNDLRVAGIYDIDTCTLYILDFSNDMCQLRVHRPGGEDHFEFETLAKSLWSGLANRLSVDDKQKALSILDGWRANKDEDCLS